jgi:hypothetical protein
MVNRFRNLPRIAKIGIVAMAGIIIIGCAPAATSMPAEARPSVVAPSSSPTSGRPTQPPTISATMTAKPAIPTKPAPTAVPTRAAPAPTITLVTTGYVCPGGDRCIKGNINDKKEKIYHFPGCASYAVTQIDESKGERWFAMAAEAEAAGWRKALNCP